MCRKLLLVLSVCSIILVSQAKGETMTKPQFIEKFFNELNATNVDRVVDAFYATDVQFADPVGSHSGSAEVKKYYKKLYEGAEEASFDFSNHVCKEDECVSFWTMHLKSKALNGGESFTVIGNSHLKFNKEGKVNYHRDYFDMGEFIYEKLPVLKNIINFIKNKLKG